MIYLRDDGKEQSDARKHTATHCNKVQHSATHCNTLQHTATHCNTLQQRATHFTKLQRIAIHCSTLQHPATPCNTLHHTATHCIVVIALLYLLAVSSIAVCVAVMLHCCTVCFSVSRVTRTHTNCSTLQYSTTHCNTLEILNRNFATKHCNTSTTHTTTHLVTVFFEV